jgi:vitamin B12 transporter
MMDGVRLNNSSGGDMNPAIVPIQIIDRIEVIKGPASSAWGSSLGGVVNIITKQTGKETTPHGSIMASYGEGHTSEVNGDAAGTAGPLSYYLYADRRDSDGLVDNRFFEDDRLYAKTELALPSSMTLGLTVDHAEPHTNSGDFQALDLTEPISDRHLLTTAYLNGQLRPDLALNFSARRLTRNYVRTPAFLGLGLFDGVSAGDLYYREHWEEETTGASLNLAWTPANHRVSLGADTTRSEVSKDTRYGDWALRNWSDYGVPVFDPVGPAMGETWGTYLNDTITWGKLSVTPGLRYDHHSISEAQTSPSLGITYRLRDDTLLRVQVARGFVFPVLSFLSISDWAYPGAPKLKPEVINSYQLGLESTAFQYLRVKTTLFVHEVQDSWVDNFPWENGPTLQRQGFEFEAETAAFSGFSAVSNLTYVRFVPEGDVSSDNSTGANLILRYDDGKTLHAELAGRYVWWDTFQSVFAQSLGEAHYSSPLWNLSLTKTLCATSRISTKAFVTAHNLFNVEQDNSIAYQNPNRWLEAGLKFKF